MALWCGRCGPTKRVRFNEIIEVGEAAEYDRRNAYRRDLTAEEAADILEELERYKRWEMHVHPANVEHVRSAFRPFPAATEGTAPEGELSVEPWTPAYGREEEVSWSEVPRMVATTSTTSWSRHRQVWQDSVEVVETDPGNESRRHSLQRCLQPSFQSLQDSFRSFQSFESHFKDWCRLFPPANQVEEAVQHKTSPWNDFP